MCRSLDIRAKALFRKLHIGVTLPASRTSHDPMRTRTRPSAHERSWLPDRLRGELGSASDRDIDAHLLVCDACLANLILHVIAEHVPSDALVPA